MTDPNVIVISDSDSENGKEANQPPKKTVPENSTKPRTTDTPKTPKELKAIENAQEPRIVLKHRDQLNLIVECLNKVAESNQFQNLLTKEEVNTFTDFQKLDESAQYSLFKLFTFCKKYRDIFTFYKHIELNVSRPTVLEHLNEFKKFKFIELEADVSNDTQHLLNSMNAQSVKEICEEFHIKKCTTKTQMVQALVNKCSSQNTLWSTRTFKDILHEKIERTMSYSIKISDQLFNTFFRMYLLHTFCNDKYNQISTFLRDTCILKETLPKYQVRQYPVFGNQQIYLEFSKAVSLRVELERNEKNKKREQVLKILEEMFQNLQKIDLKKTHDDAPFLRRYTAEGVYSACLTSFSKYFLASKSRQIKKWLEWLISNMPESHKIGKWYHDLVHYYINYHQPKNDCRDALKMVVKGLKYKRDLMDEVVLYDLSAKGRQIMRGRLNDSDTDDQREFLRITVPHVEASHFPHIIINSQCLRSNRPGQKRTYVHWEEGVKTYRSVEEVALAHYSHEGFPRGLRCETSVVQALFQLLFWDVIYDTDVKGAFVSDLQVAPLDMGTVWFYQNRREEIDDRLKQIERWTEDEAKAFISESYEKNANTVGFYNKVVTSIQNGTILLEILDCINRKVLANILRRLVRDLISYGSGMPDLLLWNIDTKKCLFVEVKGEKDMLRTNQLLWLKYLQDIGAQVEVCRVHSSGSNPETVPTRK